MSDHNKDRENSHQMKTRSSTNLIIKIPEKIRKLISPGSPSSTLSDTMKTTPNKKRNDSTIATTQPSSVGDKVSKDNNDTTEVPVPKKKKTSHTPSPSVFDKHKNKIPPLQDHINNNNAAKKPSPNTTSSLDNTTTTKTTNNTPTNSTNWKSTTQLVSQPATQQANNQLPNKPTNKSDNNTNSSVKVSKICHKPSENSNPQTFTSLDRVTKSADEVNKLLASFNESDPESFLFVLSKSGKANYTKKKKATEICFFSESLKN